MKKSSKLDEIYERLINLAVLVAEGRLDPLSVDVAKFLDVIKGIDLAKLDLSMLYKDIRALSGLITILEAQYISLKNRGLGLYVEPMLIKLKAKSLSLEKLANILLKSWTPTVNILSSSIFDLLTAYTYFMSLKPIKERRIKYILPTITSEQIESVITIPENLDLKLRKLFNELLSYSDGNWVKYEDFIYKFENPIETAYLMSFLVTMGLVEMKYRKLEDQHYIRPLTEEFEVKNVYSISVNIKGVKK